MFMKNALFQENFVGAEKLLDLRGALRPENVRRTAVFAVNFNSFRAEAQVIVARPAGAVDFPVGFQLFFKKARKVVHFRVGQNLFVRHVLQSVLSHTH